MNVNHDISEVFMSVEGEGPYTGYPTAYIRYAKCNFKCPGFNNPTNEVDKDGYAVLGFDPREYQSLQDLPPIVKGCDSQYSVNSSFSHMWERLNSEQLAEKILETVPHKSWVHPVSGLPVILSLTGGEPMLRQKQIIDLLQQPRMITLQHILFETNCSVPFRDEFLSGLNAWWKPGRKITFANSPKLRASGEKWEDAIKPDVAVRQQSVKRAKQYFKFVCGPNDEDFEEVEKAMQEYWDAGVIPMNNILIMPVACTESQQDDIAARVAQMCIERGYTFCYRVHVPVFKNKIGT